MFFLIYGVNRKRSPFPSSVLESCASSTFYTNWYKIDNFDGCTKVQQFIIFSINRYKFMSGAVLRICALIFRADWSTLRTDSICVELFRKFDTHWFFLWSYELSECCAYLVRPRTFRSVKLKFFIVPNNFTASSHSQKMILLQNCDETDICLSYQ